ncbi:uncharacterized protein [Venturia canescens]|uniref:uncharacterized protein n=1 Tax=Venturia canescens TaxID=32260 RepID=UPI001C9CF7D1|nr:uncharacterized protein LOC122406524 [Venturia canescens]
MLRASRSTGNAQEAMKPRGINRSTLFRARDTYSGSRRPGTRITSRGSTIRDDRSESVSANTQSRRKEKNRISQMNGNEAAKVLEKSESKIYLESRQVLEDFEGLRSWEWKVDESLKTSIAMEKLKTLGRERTLIFSELKSDLEKMLHAVRHMKNLRSS